MRDIIFSAVSANMISKPEQHEIDRAGKRLLREVLEPLGWVVNDVQEITGLTVTFRYLTEGHQPVPGSMFS